MKFQALLLQAGKTATGLEVPAAVVTALGTSKRPAVRVSINGFTYRSSIAVMGGRFMLPVSADVRANTGVKAGDTFEVEIELDTEPREVTVPADFDAALDADPEARRHFDAMAYSHRLRWVLSIDGAKTEETRQRRIAKAVAELHEGKP